MIRRPPRSTRTDTLFPYTTLFRSAWRLCSQIPQLALFQQFNYYSCMETKLAVKALAAIAHESRLLAYRTRSEEHTSELQSLMRTSYAVFCLKKNITDTYPDSAKFNALF